MTVMNTIRTDHSRFVALVVFVATGAAGCGDSPPGRTFYQRNIEPILTQKCAGNTSGCHSTNAGDPYKFAAGNFDVTSFDNVQKRRDVLARFGAYPYPLLLVKAAPLSALKIDYGGNVTFAPGAPGDGDPSADTFPTIDVQHSGGAVLDLNSDAFFTLQNWLDNGATENGLKPATPPQVGNGSCSDSIPPGFTKATYVTAMTQPSFDAFKATVQPILTRHGCNAASCHGAPQSDFYTTCGQSDDELAFNFSQAWSFVNIDKVNKMTVDDSQILRVPLAVSAGGRGHTGGDQFASKTDPDYVAIQTWAKGIGQLDFVKDATGKPDARKQFFANNIQPLLLRRGCSFEACHSPAATNDFKLRSGTQGFFSAVALQKNYDLLKSDFLALEFPDARRGRAIAKALLSSDNDATHTAVAGIEHRGGPVLETQGEVADRAACPPFDPAQPAVWNPDTTSAFCTFQAWIDLERSALLTAGQVTPMDSGKTIPIVYVQRSTAAADRLSFDTFQGGSDLRVVNATFGADEAINPAGVGGSTSLSAGCPGLTAAADIQAPDVANDGDRVVFAARNAAGEPLGVFVVPISAPASCVRVTPAVPDVNNLKVHNFDPAFSPDGNWIVFASTRGKPSGPGPTRSRKRFLPQSDLWRVAINGLQPDPSSYEQITFLSNSEISPQFMREGRITMTTEKVSDGFYQLSGRRINWDRTDYHPLLAQRASSAYADLTDLTQTKPSIGFASATDIREGSDGNFVLILSDLAADGSPVSPGGGGALGIFNRSIGPFEQGRTDTGFIPALRILNSTNMAAATGRAGSAASYRAPVTLPNGEIMVAYAPNAGSADFDIVAISPRTGAQRLLLTGGGAGTARVDAVLAYKYPARQLYDNRRQLVFGGNDAGDQAHGVVHMPDAPLLFTLLTGNLRRGRPVDAFRKAKYLAAYSEGLCPVGGCTAGPNGIFESRQMLGSAPLADDGSVRVQLPSGAGVVLELQDDKRASIVKMGEEHQLGPGEQISMGVSESLFNAVCAGCHGSVSGQEIDIGVTPDALTGASASKSATAGPASIGP